MNRTLETVIHSPAQPAEGSVIWLHGLGADGHDFAGIVPALCPADAPALRFIFPHAPQRPVTMANHAIMRAWFDIDHLDRGTLDMSGIQASYDAIVALINAERDHGIPLERIILAGFSQGGCMALYTGLMHPETIGGVIGLSTYLPEHQALRQARNRLPIFLAHGTQDTVLPHSMGEHTHQLLQKMGQPVEWHSYKMPHTVIPTELQDIQQWLQRILSQRTQ